MFSSTNLAGRAFLLIVIAAATPVILMLFLGNPWGHDLFMHMYAWMDAEQQLREGIVFPRWAAGANYGFGQPFFIFYPPLSWTTGATLGLILPWKAVPGAYVWLVTMLAGAAMWKCASNWLNPPDAVMAGVLYALNPYVIIMAYKRCSYAELFASALFPLLVWAGVRMGRDANKTVLPLTIVFAAIWLADLPAAVVASYSLAWLLLCNSFLHRSLRPVLYGAVAILAAFGSIAAFLLPAAWERKWVNIGALFRDEFALEKHFLFAKNNTPPLLAFNRGMSLIAVFLVIVAVIAAVVTRRLRRDAPADWRLLTALGALSTFMMFPQSLILWRILPELRFVGLPWRWLSPLCVVAVLLVSSAVAQARRKWTLWMPVVFVVAAIGAGIVHHVSWDSQNVKDLVATPSGLGYPSIPTWSNPLGSQPSKLSGPAPLIASTDPEDEKELSRRRLQIHVELWSPEKKVFSVDAPRPLLLAIKLLSYPAWQAKLNGKIVSLETEKETGQMLLPVPAGFSRAEIKFVRTWDRTVGMAVSFATVLALVPLMLFLRRWEISASRVLKNSLFGTSHSL